MAYKTTTRRPAFRPARRTRPSARRRQPAASPSTIRRRWQYAATAAVIAAVVAGATVRFLINHSNTTFSEIAIQPRPGSMATVNADVSAELAQAAANGGELVLTEIAGDTTAAPALDTALSCPPGTNTLICGQNITQATSKAAKVSQQLVGNPAPANLDLYAVFEQTADYLSEHPGHHQAINLWVNTTGDQLTPFNLTRVTAGSDIAALARQAVTTGAFPGPHACQGYQVHLVVPPSGTPAHQQALHTLLSTLIKDCGGTLASWTNRWITPNASAIALPRIPAASISHDKNGVTYTLSDALKDFAVGSANLSRAAKAALTQVAADIQARAPGQPVTCTGSTDGTGTSAFDLALSDKRATTVCNYLAEQGISPHLLHAVGAGKATPTAANPNLRRVIIKTG
jgi:outer membrane protein OmpA-like peptidoglycan-associated protein